MIKLTMGFHKSEANQGRRSRYDSEYYGISLLEWLPVMTMWLNEERGLWSIKPADSPLIQFKRCCMHDERLRSGRIWLEMESVVYDAATEREYLVKKDERLLALYNRLARWLRKNLVKDPETRCYLGPEAARLREHGIQLAVP